MGSKLARGIIGLLCLFYFQSSVADTYHLKVHKENAGNFFQARDQWQQLQSHPLEPLHDSSQGFYHQYLTRIDRYVTLSPSQIQAMDFAKDSYWEEWWQSLEKELKIGHIAVNEEDLYSLINYQDNWMMMSHNDQVFLHLDNEIKEKPQNVQKQVLPISSSDVFYALLSKKNKTKGS